MKWKAGIAGGELGVQRDMVVVVQLLNYVQLNGELPTTSHCLSCFLVIEVGILAEHMAVQTDYISP